MVFRGCRRPTGHVGVLVALLIALVLALPASAGAASYTWAAPSMTFVRSNNLVTAATLDRGPGALATRRAYVRALAQLEAYRAARGGPPAQLPSVQTGATLTDVAPTSIYAKAVTLGWIAPINGAFAGTTGITADEASRGVVGALGLRPSATIFANRMQAEFAPLRVNFYLKAAHVYTRALRLRYNHLAGTEALERSPREAFLVSHMAYMLHKAAVAERWRLDSVRKYEQFDIPALGPNQKIVLHTGVRLIGQPYVWGGETEGRQAEGHGGFDCSGFVWRVIMNSGVPVTNRVTLRGRTSMAMSGEIATSRRIYSVANLRPADIMFWGYNGRNSTPSQNYHAGIYLGNNWFIHSSGGNDGVTINYVEGYWQQNYSWGRRGLRVA